MKIAILAIATNNYKTLLKNLIFSIEGYLLPGVHKDVFVFSDEDEFSNTFNNIKFTKINHEKWPFITLKRFEFFSKRIDDLKEYDYVYYFDCDLEIIRTIETMPEGPLFGVQHPAAYYFSNFWDIETNKDSLAYLDKNNPWIYHQGCFWGGQSKNVIEMIEILKENINKDLQNNIVAKWHDESHLNNYFFKNKNLVTTLPSSFCYPEKWNLPIEKIILHKDKNMIEYPRFEGVK